jgi:opacity protein-like surface antigen
MKRFLQLTILFLSIPVMAQEKWSASFRPTLHFPTKSVLDEPLRIGNGIDITATYFLGKQTKLYTGFVLNNYDTDQDYDEVNIAFTQRGILFGGMYFFNLVSNQKYPLYARAGLTFTDVKSRSVGTTFDIDTKWAFGTQLGIGIKIASLKNWYILPEIRLSNTSHRYTFNGSKGVLSFGSISITGGIMRTF